MLEFGKKFSSIDPSEQASKAKADSDVGPGSPLQSGHVGQELLDISPSTRKRSAFADASSSRQSELKKAQAQVKLHLQTMPSGHDDLSPQASNTDQPNRLLSKNSQQQQHQSYQNAMLPHYYKLNMSVAANASGGSPSLTVMMP